MPPSRFTTFVVLAAVGITTLFLLSSSTREVASTVVQGAVDAPKAVKDKIYEFDVPDIHWSFHKSGHKPPVQKNSTNGESSWHSDWRWLNPFSSSITWDEDRTVLPPLPERPFVYTYYDTTIDWAKEQKELDADMLEVWKRAWWAQGFTPVVLTQAEALNHPLYQRMLATGPQKALVGELERWLAWAHMGTGILASWHALPMAAYDDPSMRFLRRGRYEKLTRFDGLESGLFAGEKSQINDAIADSLGDAKLGTYKTIIEAIHSDRFRVEKSDAIAHYDRPTIAKKYQTLETQFVNEPLKAQRSLVKLVNAHLHIIWQNTFKKGIRVLKPIPAHSTKLVEPAQHLARLLTECPESILQSSCPPNKPRCTPCVASKMTVETKESFANDSAIFTVATVPHPLTMVTLTALSDKVDVAFIRRDTKRDEWIKWVTRNILGDGRGGPSRVVGFKDAVASEFSRFRGIWFTVEHFPPDFDAPPEKPKSPTNDPHPEKQKIAPFPEHWLEEQDWFVGFAIPRDAVSHGESYNPVPGQGSDIKGLPAERKGSYEPKDPTHDEATKEVALLKKARETIKSKDKNIRSLRAAAEAWNLADTEAWKFARAYRARSLVERAQWEEDEAAYSGPGTSRGGRWF